jgi:hypothetical protein
MQDGDAEDKDDLLEDADEGGRGGQCANGGTSAALEVCNFAPVGAVG